MNRKNMDEKKARGELYFHKAELSHLNLTLTDIGLVVHPQYPYLGASPDGAIAVVVEWLK